MTQHPGRPTRPAASGESRLRTRDPVESRVLQALRHAGTLAADEIASDAALSPDTARATLRSLLEEQALRETGPDSLAINAAHAFSIGVKIGRRSLDALLIDFTGAVLHRTSYSYDYPDPEQIFPRLAADIDGLVQTLSEASRERLAGIGVAAPHSLGGWYAQMHAPPEVFSQWDRIDLRERLGSPRGLPVLFENDANAACIADLAFGRDPRFDNYLHVFVGTFIGGGTVLNGTLYAGAFDNAGAVGSMPVHAAHAWGPGRGQGERATTQLINCASRYLLDDSLLSVDFDPEHTLQQLAGDDPDALPGPVRDICEAWLGNAAHALAHAITAAISVVDFAAVVIDGWLPPAIVDRLCVATDHALGEMDLLGLVRPRLVARHLGNEARALGGAILPLYGSFIRGAAPSAAAPPP